MSIPERPARRVWLVRHGESDWNVDGLAQGQAPGPVLTALGTAQCERVARVLAGCPIRVIYASDLGRAHQSAAIVGQRLGVPIVLESALRERALGRAEGRPSTWLIPSSGIRDGRVEDPDRAPLGGETVRELYGRVAAFASSFEPDDPDGDAVLVTHGGVIRVLLAWARGSGPDDMAWPPVGNGTVVPCVLPAPDAPGAKGREPAGGTGRTQRRERRAS